MYVFDDRYDIEEGSFIDPPKEFLKPTMSEGQYCPCCDREEQKQKFNIPEAVDMIEESDTEEKSSGSIRYASSFIKNKKPILSDPRRE